MDTRTRSALLCLGALAGACEYDEDFVATGFYGAPIEASGGRVAEPWMPPGLTGGVVSSSSGGAIPSGAGGDATQPSAGGGGSAPVAGGEVPGPSGACDMSGRWLVTVHQTTDALGQLQISHSYLYYEISQQGDAFTVTRGIECGYDAIGLGAFAVTVDFRPTWPSAIEKVRHSGRSGRSVESGGGCTVEFDKWVQVRGASVPHYQNPSVALPTADQRAADGTPGWEDWDGDGNPGITGTVSGAVNGKIFVAPRGWTEFSATVPDLAQTLRMPLLWDQEPNVMAFDGSPLLGSAAARAANPDLHLVELARLADGQAVGDEATLCAEIVALAPTLTPAAAAAE